MANSQGSNRTRRVAAKPADAEPTAPELATDDRSGGVDQEDQAVTTSDAAQPDAASEGELVPAADDAGEQVTGSADPVPADASTDETTTAPADDEPADDEPVQKEARDGAFSRERILGDEGALLTGQDTWVIAGALEGVEGDDFTADEVKDLVRKYHKREVQEG